MKKVFFLFLFSALFIHAQLRNDRVRSLNTIVDYMDESSRINRELYWDIKQFAEGYIHSSSPKKNNNYWYTHANPQMRLSVFDNAGRFPEVHVDSENMFSDFEYILFPYLEARESMDKLLASKFFTAGVEKEQSWTKKDVRDGLVNFKLTMDTLVVLHKELYDYVNNKQYLSDANYTVALSIIDRTSHILDNYHYHAWMLYATLNQHYWLYDSPQDLKGQTPVRAGILYAWMIIQQMESWEYDLFNGDDSKNKMYDSIIRFRNDQGLSLDSSFFYKTYGYGISSNGAMPHTRYTIFFEMMKSTLYWYAKDKYAYPAFMKKSDVHYNEYVDRTHMSIEDYADLLECTDGHLVAKNLSYSIKTAVQVGIDTSQVVYLKRPRWGYIFHFVKKEEEQPVHTLKIDTVVTEHQQLINNASPHHMIFLLDISASMNDPGKLDLLKEGAKYLVGLQRKSDRISLLTFSTHSHTLLKNVSCDQKESINKKIDELHAHGATNASDGVRNSFGIADSNHINSGKNKIILVTDGKFQLDGDASKLLGNFKKKNIELIILLVGSKEDPQLEKDFEKISKKGNGKFYKVSVNNVQDILIKEASD